MAPHAESRDSRSAESAHGPAGQVHRRRHTQRDRLPGDPQMKMHRFLLSLALTLVPAMRPGPDSRRASEAADRFLADLQRRLFRPPLQSAERDQLLQRAHPVARLGDALRRRGWREAGGAAAASGSADQIDAADGERHSLLHLAQQCVGGRRAHRPRAVALPISAEHGQHHRQPRRRHVRQLAVLRNARQQPGEPGLRAPARSAGRCRSPIRSSTTPRPWRRSWSAITSSSASAATIWIIPASCNRAIPKPARCNGSGGPRRAKANPASRPGRTNTRPRTAPGRRGSRAHTIPS